MYLSPTRTPPVIHSFLSSCSFPPRHPMHSPLFSKNEVDKESLYHSLAYFVPHFLLSKLLDDTSSHRNARSGRRGPGAPLQTTATTFTTTAITKATRFSSNVKDNGRHLCLSWTWTNNGTNLPRRWDGEQRGGAVGRSSQRPDT